MPTVEVDSPAPVEIQAALAEFSETPGKFSVRRREPAVLFGAIREILVIASGRGSSPGTEPTLSEQHAACFFVKAALLRDGADHYTLMGLDREDGDAAVKAHYRLMMRLIHPDFAIAASAQWPADAAPRVNRAYQILSSPVLRREYDERLRESGPSDSLQSELAYGTWSSDETFKADPLAARRAELMRRKLKRVVAFCGLAAVGLIAYMASSFDRGHQVDLVQRKTQNTQRAAKVLEVKEPQVVDVNAEKPRQLPPEKVSDSPPNIPVGVASAATARGQGNVPAGSATVINQGLAVAREPARLELQRATGLGIASKAVVGKLAASATLQNEEAPTIRKEIASEALPSPSVFKTDTSMQDGVDSRPAVKALAKPDPALAADGPSKEKSAVRLVTMADAQPLIANLLHQLETGRGNNLLTVMDSDARRESSSLAFASYYDGFVGGARTVKLSQVELRPETAVGRLLVTGFVRLQLGDDTSSTKRLALRVEFASRGGAVVMTRLTGTEAADR